MSGTKKFLGTNQAILYAAGILIGLYVILSVVNNTIVSANPGFIGVPLLLWCIYTVYFLVYRWAVSRPDSELSITMIISVAALIGLILLFSVPMGQNDFYHYFFEDVAWRHYGLNPYFTVPAQLPTETASIVSGWPLLPSQHGPARALLTLPAWWLSGNSLVAAMLWYRVLFLAYGIGSLWLVYQIAQRIKSSRPRLSALVFGWSPLLWYGTLLQGGTDVMLVFWLLLAVYWAIDRRTYWSLGALVVSILIKYVTVLALPLFLWFYLVAQKGVIKKIVSGGLYLVVIALITVVFWAPFWRGMATLSGLVWVANYFESNSAPGFFITAATLVWPSVRLDMAKIFFELLFGASYALLVVSFVRQSALTGRRLILSMVWIFGLYLLLGKFWFYAKYLIWLIPLLSVLDKRLLGLAVFFAGAIVFSPVYSDLFIILMIPPTVVFALYFFLRHQFAEFQLV